MKLQKIIEDLKALLSAADVEEAELKTPDGVILLAAGEPTAVEIARSGKFKDMHGVEVDVTPALMKALAASVDLSKHEPKLKLGHKPIESDTPDYGSVQKLAYDETKDRLMATIEPTGALVKQVRSGAFNRRSMEFAYDAATGVARFLHLGFLGARNPAIKGLAPIALASGAAAEAEPTILCTEAEEPEESEAPKKAVDKGGKSGAVAQVAAAAATPEGDEETKKMSNERIAKMAEKTAIAQAKAFLDANVKRIPLKLLKAGLEAKLVSLLTAEGASDEPGIVKFADAEGKEKTETVGEFVLGVLAAFPELVTADEKAEVAKGGKDDEAIPAEFADADRGSVEIHLAVESEIAEAKAKGETINYLQGVQRVERKRRGAK
jgi:hypothetical protein